MIHFDHTIGPSFFALVYLFVGFSLSHPFLSFTFSLLYPSTRYFLTYFV